MATTLKAVFVPKRINPASKEYEPSELMICVNAEEEKLIRWFRRLSEEERQSVNEMVAQWDDHCRVYHTEKEKIS